jgi:hypothetical protein
METSHYPAPLQAARVRRLAPRDPKRLKPDKVLCARGKRSLPAGGEELVHQPDLLRLRAEITTAAHPDRMAEVVKDLVAAVEIGLA